MVASLAAGAAIVSSAQVEAEALPGQAPLPVYAFDWPSQPLHDALQQYSKLTGDSVLYDSGQTAGKTVPALTGSYTAREALARLLVGTELQARYTAPQALLLMPRMNTPSAPSAPRVSHAARQQFYGLLQIRVLAALCARPALRTGDYRAALRVSIDHQHALSDVQVHATGRPEMEPALREVLAGLPVGAPPPGFGLPVVLVVSPEAARRHGGCAP
ncbi:STN domain-containing protein [Achromobacter sp.]|uniref:STN domain-containing protein n=1 Tax=Achromobacter sp. TaxID=134375 RepID=UPI002F940888